MKVKVQKIDGKASGDIELNDDVFGIEPRADILHRVVTWQLENRRGNLAKTTAWLILQDDPEEARDPNEDERMYARPDIEEGPVLAQPVLQSNLVHENPEMTVLDLRRMLADSNSKPLERTILR